MEAFGALLWAAAVGILVLLYAAVVAYNGLSPDGWRRTSAFYTVTSLVTLPLPALVLFGSGPPLVGAPLVIAAALRQIQCIPLGLAGLGLAALAKAQGRGAGLLLATALLNLLAFAYPFARALIRG